MEQSSYVIKEIEKLILCIYGVIIHLENVRRILKKRVKHEAMPRVLHASLVFSYHFLRALSVYHTINARDSFSISFKRSTGAEVGHFLYFDSKFVFKYRKYSNKQAKMTDNKILKNINKILRN